MSYENGKTPSDYVCRGCGATGRKLWREHASFCVDLRCVLCANVKTGKTLSNKGWWIGDHVPAIPTESNDGYWGFTSVPEPAIKWWLALPE